LNEEALMSRGGSSEPTGSLGDDYQPVATSAIASLVEHQSTSTKVLLAEPEFYIVE
jgi:hypothetical protein